MALANLWCPRDGPKGLLSAHGGVCAGQRYLVMNAVDRVIRWSTALVVLGVAALVQVSTTFTWTWTLPLRARARGYRIRSARRCLVGARHSPALVAIPRRSLSAGRGGNRPIRQNATPGQGRRARLRSCHHRRHRRLADGSGTARPASLAASTSPVVGRADPRDLMVGAPPPTSEGARRTWAGRVAGHLQGDRPARFAGHAGSDGPHRPHAPSLSRSTWDRSKTPNHAGYCSCAATPCSQVPPAPARAAASTHSWPPWPPAMTW